MRGPDAFRHNSRFKAWLEKDPRHRETYQRLTGHWDASYRLTSPELVRAATGIREASTRRSRRRIWLVPALTTSLLAVSGAGFALLVRDRDRPPAAVLATELGQQKSLVLVDGSWLVLDADSAVAPSLTAHTRTVRLLRGRARFMVADARTPLFVLAGDVVVTADGARFDIDRLGADRTDVILLRGAIDVARRDRFDLLGPVQQVRLTGRQSLTLRSGSRAVMKTVAPADPDWTLTPLSFDRTPLGDVLVEANRYSRRKIRLGSPDLASLQITGMFDTEASQGLGQALARTLGLSLETAANGDLVLSRRAA